VQLPLQSFLSSVLIEARQLSNSTTVIDVFAQLFELPRHTLHAGHSPAARSFASHMKQLKSACFLLPSNVHGAALLGVHPHPGGVAVTPTLTEFVQEEPVPATAAKKELSSKHSLPPESEHSLVPFLRSQQIDRELVSNGKA
jgi:hypothetical protein